MGDDRLIQILLCADIERSRLAAMAGQSGWRVLTPDDLQLEDHVHVALIELDESMLQDNEPRAVRRRYPLALLVDCSNKEARADVDLTFDAASSAHFVPQLLRHAARHWRNNIKINELVRDVGLRRRRMHQLNEISMALTGNMSQHELLETILTEARRIGNCEAGSLFLIERDGAGRQGLVFKLAQNDVVNFPFVETKLPMSAESIAGYVASTGHELNIRDVYQLPDDVPFKFNRSFDDLNGYRTKSVLAIAMCDHRGEVVGVLQFLNRYDPDSGEVLAFEEETAEILRAIASQAAVSIQKNALIEDVHRLFESFVQASVKTIEKRDPSTSGHSFRVAESTVALLQALPESGMSRFRGLELTSEHIREVRYAALLHDFGKVGVPEAVLVKANKLSDERLEILRYRIELQKERLCNAALQDQLELMHHGSEQIELARRRILRKLEKQLTQLDQFFDWIRTANLPNVMDEGDFAHLQEIRAFAFKELDGSIAGVITDRDLQALSVRRGSLTPDERKVIENHVVYTKEFLSVLPWPPELAGVPEIAGAHHERLDGSGYPDRLVEEQIPLASKVMAVCDVYDALTAFDRPYKPAISHDHALAILQEEAQRGLLDPDMVNVFIDSGSYNLARAI